MPFNLSQIFGGWRRKESRGRKTSGSGREKSRGIPPISPSLPVRQAGLTKGGGEGEGFSSSGVKPLAEKRKPKQIAPVAAKGQSELAWRLVIAPHVSERATMLGEGKYVFKVADTATKSNLKRAVEDRYGVEVLAINMIQARSKKRRRGAITGEKSGFKKAIVTLKAGHKISEF